ncbi:hypothetical protein FSP39_023476 [Pinctada imbricata]|uniref:Desmoplakin SH3 domain-containing protein n=1 Tax=Pinctada imbricata TaxID=66713 RepID=A0AA89C210_PINIB|nr:hypothetical protein FSP39_023476 [Pinctada imbricata]
MAKEDVQKCLEWLLNEQNELENSSFGFCKAEVGDSSVRHRSRAGDVTKYRSNIQRLMTRHSLTSKRSSCLEVLQGISRLEEQIQSLTSDFDAKALHLVNLQENNKEKGALSLSNDSLVKTAQNCNSAVKKNWRWISTMMECSHVHLLNASAYHQFFHEVEEVEYWMNTTLSRIHLTFDRSKLNGERNDVQIISDEMKDTLKAYLQWQGKVENLFERAKDIVPLQKRIESVSQPLPVTALTDYKTNEIEIIEGETLTLLDSSKRESWLVENSRKQSCHVPAAIILIPAPSGEAVDAAIGLRMQLLALWTTSIKRLGYQMIAFMTLVFRDWTPEEIMMLQNLTPKEKEALTRVLDNIDQSLDKNWNGYGDYQKLQEKILQLRMIMESQDGSGKISDSEELSTLVIQIKSLDDLLASYRDFWAYWETFKVIVELLREPKHLLVCDKWDQLKFVTTAHFVKFWDTTLDLQLEDITREGLAITLHEKPKEPLPAPPKRQVEEMAIQEVQDIQVCEVQPLQHAAEETTQMSTEEYETFNAHETTTEMTTDEVSSSMEEEQSTYVILGVTDPRNDKDLTVQEATAMGLLDQAAGVFFNPLTKENMTIIEAMNEGLILFKLTSRKKIRQEEKSYGILTIKTTKENRPFTIRKVIDPKTEEELTTSQATERGILNIKNSTYVTETGETISIYDAIHSGLIIADYQNGGEHTPDASVEMKTYSVHGVMDLKQKKKVPFSEAQDRGLLDGETGEFLNTATNERIPITDAIIKGFIKARVVTDTSKLNIDPERQMVVEKFSSAKDKILTKIKASKAFQGALTK